ncbi:uncharacterized protein At4g04980 [Arachis duranensis]|uniref:Uncharacterized protein At4g04980 n=1 Tax=Arachis duranensis TaxID=130453 RepID=A0A6P4BUJ0_ARADU|nr:uncharacterized protein At4g04980 [Arachis duranensis]
MASSRLCGFPLLNRRRTYDPMKGTNSSPKKQFSKSLNEGKKGESMEWSFVSADQLMLMIQVHKKILVFRDIIDLAPLNTSISLREMVITTLGDLHGLYPGIILQNKVSRIKDKSTDQALAYFCEVLKSIGESWIMNSDCTNNINCVFPSCKDRSNMLQLGETLLATLDCMIKIANDKFDIMEEDYNKNEFGTFGKSTPTYGSPSFHGSSFLGSSSPDTPRGVLPEPMKYPARTGENSPKSSGTSPLRTLRIQSLGKLNPIDLKRLSFHMSPPHKATQNKKINEEPDREMEVDHKDGKDEKDDTSEDLVFSMETTEKSEITNADHKECDEAQAMQEEKEEKSQSPKPLETTAMLMEEAPKLAPSSNSSPLSPVVTATNVMQPNKAMLPPPPPPPPPPAPSSAKLQKSVVALNIPPPPSPPPVPLSSSLSSVSSPPSPSPPIISLKAGSASPPPPPMSLKAGSAPPPPPPMSLKSGSAPAPPPPLPRGNGGAALPPPPPGSGRCLRPKATTKLKRSTQLGALYRTLKGKVEGSSLKGKSGGGRSSSNGAASSSGGKQSMADALAEMTKRSSYFQQIEEDVQKYAKQIQELRSAITNYKTKDMTDLIKFHQDVESVLEKLTDESQVLSRFEDFPSKKLEAMRMAAALYNKLNSILNELQNWKIVSPVNQLLEKTERYFDKIKTELEALERTKDEESKKFKGHNIEFDFHILIKIKEAMVDVSSNCMELALKERRSDAAKNNSDGKRKDYAKLLWRAFQFAFKVYTFAGGIDDRADKLTKELAREIESDPNQP